jgi:hypothetical protein
LKIPIAFEEGKEREKHEEGVRIGGKRRRREGGGGGFKKSKTPLGEVKSTGQIRHQTQTRQIKHFYAANK